MIQDRILQFQAMRSGTVIDHIPAQMGIKLFTLLKLNTADKRITIVLNLPSRRQSTKDIIKLENIFITEDQVNQLSIYFLHATINHIDNYYVVSKQTVLLQGNISGLFECPNSNCISRSAVVSSSFVVESFYKKVSLVCSYCENTFEYATIIHGI